VPRGNLTTLPLAPRRPRNMSWFARALSLVLLVVTSDATTAAEVCSVCAPKALCTQHESEEIDHLGRLRARMKSKSVDERAAAVRDAAALTRKHENAPTARVAKFIAGALNDDDMVVRTAAVVALLSGQHVETTVPALEAHLQKRAAILEKKPQKLNPGGGSQSTEKMLENLEKQLEDTALRIELLQGAPRICEYLAAHSPQCDRSVRSFYERLARSELRSHCREIAPHLLQCGTHAAFRATIQALAFEPIPAKTVADDHVKRIADGKWTTTDDWRDKVHVALIEAQERLKLPAPTFTQPRLHEAWFAWLESVKDKLPAPTAAPK
jgi:tRNA isopentenyl-2-thiomethyl-A-37 hydroxylase MiaE